MKEWFTHFTAVLIVQLGEGIGTQCALDLEFHGLLDALLIVACQLFHAVSTESILQFYDVLIIRMGDSTLPDLVNCCVHLF